MGCRGRPSLAWSQFFPLLHLQHGLKEACLRHKRDGVEQLVEQLNRELVVQKGKGNQDTRQVHQVRTYTCPSSTCAARHGCCLVPRLTRVLPLRLRCLLLQVLQHLQQAEGRLRNVKIELNTHSLAAAHLIPGSGAQ